MNPATVKAAAHFLHEHWDRGTHIDGLPTELRPLTRADGYAIQQVIESRTAGPLFGWKLAATSEAGQHHIGVDGPLAGRLIKERVIADDGDYCLLSRNVMRVAELEFAFRFARDIRPRNRPWDLAKALGEVESLHPAIEIPDSRYKDFETAGAPQLIADNACAHYFVLGAAASESWRRIDLADHRVRALTNNGDLRHGIGRNVLGDPRIALVWFLDEMSRIKVTVRADQVVTTGTCLQPIVLTNGVRVSGDFGVLGSVSVNIV